MSECERGINHASDQLFDAKCLNVNAALNLQPRSFSQAKPFLKAAKSALIIFVGVLVSVLCIHKLYRALIKFWEMSETKKRRGPRCTQAQQEHIIQYMMQNELFARTGKTGIRGNDNYINQWKILAEDLNKLGHAKTWQVWLKAWQGIVRRARDKKENIRKMVATGQLQLIQPLTDQDEKVLATVGLETYVWDEVLAPYGLEEVQVEENDIEITESEVKAELSDTPPDITTIPPDYQPGTSAQPTTPTRTDFSTEKSSRKRPWDFMETLSTLNSSSKDRADELKRTNDILERWLPQISADLQSLNTTIQTVGRTLTDMRDEAEETADNTASMRRIFMRHFSKGEEDESE